MRKKVLLGSTSLVLTFAVVAAACGGGGSATTEVAVSDVIPPPPPTLIINTEDGETPVPPPTTTRPTTTTVPRETPPAPHAPQQRVQAYILTAKPRPSRSTGQIAELVYGVYNSPGGTLMHVVDGNPVDPNPWGQPLNLMVTRGQPGDDWAEVLISSRPNGLKGWIKTDQFEWSTHEYQIVIDLSDRTVTVWNGDELLAHTLAITGRPTRPTPITTTYVTSKLNNAVKSDGTRLYGSAYGTWILPVAAFSETLETFSGGIPQIAIHGTNIPERVGEELSSGCIRIPNEVIELLVETIPVGTVVKIVA